MTNKFTWFGHSTLGLETGGQHLIVDPFFNGRGKRDISLARKHAVDLRKLAEQLRAHAAFAGRPAEPS